MMNLEKFGIKNPINNEDFLKINSLICKRKKTPLNLKKKLQRK